MSRKFIISEDERARILGLHETAKSNHGTVISEQSIGIGFKSGEPNGLKIKKEENMEQVAGKTPTTMTPSQTQMKPTYELNSVAYYVPGIDDTKLNNFVNIFDDSFQNYSTTQERKFFEKNLGFKSGLDANSNPFGVPDETFEKYMLSYKPDKPQPPYIQNYINMVDALKESMLAYLKYWRPNVKGVDVLKSRGFMSDPAVVRAKKFISNFDEVLPRVLQIASKTSGLNIA